MHSIVISVAAAESLNVIKANVRKPNYKETPQGEENVHVVNLQLSSIVRVLLEEKVYVYVSNFADDVRQEVLMKVTLIQLHSITLTDGSSLTRAVNILSKHVNPLSVTTGNLLLVTTSSRSSRSLSISSASI